MAPVPSLEMAETQSMAIVLSVMASVAMVSMMALTAIGCGCCKGKKAEEEKPPAAAAEGEEAVKGPGEETTRKAPPKAGVTGGNRMYRTMMDVDKEDFAPSDKKEAAAPKEPSQKKKASGPVYIEVDMAPAAGSKKSAKKAVEKKKGFASGRDPAYRSLMGLDDKFEPSNKGK